MAIELGRNLRRLGHAPVLRKGLRRPNRPHQKMATARQTLPLQRL